MKRYWIQFLILIFSISAGAEQIICESTCKGDHLRILFKDRIFAGINHTDDLVNFKIKCRDQGGREDSGHCGHGKDTAYGFFEHYCVVSEEITAIGRSKPGSSLNETKQASIDRCYSKLHVQPDCETFAGNMRINPTSTQCRLE
jgi:hypothetical protein